VGYDVCIIGGSGHAGLPLAICFAKEGKRVAIFDIDERACSLVSSGMMPFREENADEILKEVLATGLLHVSATPEVMSQGAVLVMILGTPVDAHLNPSFSGIVRTVRNYLPYFRDGQLLVLRSTVFPGTSEKIDRLLKDAGLSIDVAFCPERIAEGHALRETYELPQIISAFTPEGMRRARELFATFTEDIVELLPMEAELAKLFTNAWRYIRFSIANQFYSIANDHGLDYYRIHEAMTHNYPRARDLPGAGFAAGPCLLKDTMQLAAFSENKFFLGHAAMLINEGLPAYIVNCLKQRYRLRDMVVGILGMAFKADSDDPRESLSYKLRKILEIECRDVLITDPYVADERIIPVEEVVERSDILILGAPHGAYRDLDLSGKHVVDVWNFYGKGGLIA
jgi:UDP-N-acetyl-D-mannosaminuronic acid dehydrogenase